MSPSSSAQTDPHFERHGRIKCGTIIVPDIEVGISAYRDVLGMALVDRSPVSKCLCNLWGTPVMAGKPSAMLRHVSGAPCFLRLIENELPSDFVPTTTFGWAAFEHTSLGAFDWPKKLEGSAFEIVGPPREIAGLAYFVPMQVFGPGQEMVYLNEVHQDTPTTDLPKANADFDHMFIAVLAAPDREAAVKWYANALQLDEGETHVIEYTMINRAFGQPKGTQSTLTMIQQDRMPIVEIDTYPAAATHRSHRAGTLPPGNAMVTLAVRDFAELDVEWIAEPQPIEGPLYDGRRTGTVVGPAGELLELIELGNAAP
ncbi:MAG: hypothetical protein ABJ239_07765 [Erythrobacter sp.]